MASATFHYKNHRGEVEFREVSQVRLEFITNPGYGYQPGWFLSGHDKARNARRSFRLSHIQLDADARFGQNSGFAILLHDER